MRVYEPMKLCISLGLQFLAFMRSQRLRTGLVQPTHQTEEKTSVSLKEKRSSCSSKLSSPGGKGAELELGIRGPKF